MNQLNNELFNILIDLKENHHIVGVKAEFGIEAATFDEIKLLKEFAAKLDINLTIKISGCEAIKDLYEAKEINANVIVVPMIESSYAMQKFVECSEIVFKEEQKPQLLINVETINAYENINSIVKSPYFSKIDGIVLGRDDMVNSLSLTKEFANSNKIYDISLNMAEISKKFNKTFIIGGCITPKSVEFLSKLQNQGMTNFETRKVIFDVKNPLSKNEIEVGILKALEFEILWIQNRRNSFNIHHNEDDLRLNMLKNIIVETRKVLI